MELLYNDISSSTFFLFFIMIYIGLTVLLYQAEESDQSLKESEGNVRASFCSNGGVDSGSESENMFLATFSSELELVKGKGSAGLKVSKDNSGPVLGLELGLVNDKNNVMSSDSKVDCEIKIVNNVELDLESEFICSVNFEKGIISVSCSLPDEPFIGF
ncbi:hypothetical protein C2G38_2035697 [Gigaspora rosea]|uniref:Uncharacterized protein n=1 Tax=Gigaspora rosea TaxID=44941 RepID=A0A397VL42_9GLOM|nr:hypothetical protein C2G38_2035697 [Gigaspora rosea]